jgi:hypothetical protein
MLFTPGTGNQGGEGTDHGTVLFPLNQPTLSSNQGGEGAGHGTVLFPLNQPTLPSNQGGEGAGHGTVRVFRRGFALEDASEFHDFVPLEA